MADNPKKKKKQIEIFSKQKHTADISYANTPNAHQSTALLYPLDKIISGAKYSIHKSKEKHSSLYQLIIQIINLVFHIESTFDLKTNSIR